MFVIFYVFIVLGSTKKFCVKNWLKKPAKQRQIANYNRRQKYGYSLSTQLLLVYVVANCLWFNKVCNNLCEGINSKRD